MYHPTNFLSKFPLKNQNWENGQHHYSPYSLVSDIFGQAYVVICTSFNHSVVLQDENVGGKSQNHSTAPTSNNAPSSSAASSAIPSANLNQLFKPVPVLPNPDDMNLGEEIAGKMNKQALLKTLNALYLSKSIKELSKEHGMDDYIYHQVTIQSASFLQLQFFCFVCF